MTQTAWRLSCVILLCAVLAACGGGGGGGGGNSAPTASFTASPTTGTAPLTVVFDASASTDPGGSVSGYAWNFGDGSTGSGVTATHTFVAGGSYTVTLTVTDSAGATGTTTRTVTATGTTTTVTVSGRITYERVPFRNPNATDSNSGLDYAGTFAAPARSVLVELVDASSRAVLATAMTDDDGNYALQSPADRSVLVRAKAQVRTAGAGDIRVLNDTNSNALYALDSSSFNTGTANLTRNLLADSGWPGFGGTAYSGPRAAAPFAIADTIYSAVRFVRANVATLPNLPSLDVFWSTEGNSTHYDSEGIHLFGLDGTDTDEFDQHVVAHEFQHFLEDATSRSDSPGGDHSRGERLDLRLAFSEGFANSFSAMVLADPVYKDSQGAAQSFRFDFNVETDSPSRPGWFDEGSVAGLAWDLFDAANENADAVSLGYGPMFEVFSTSLRNGSALTSLYPFVDGLKARAGAPAAAIDALVKSQSVSVFGTGIYGAGETNSGDVTEALPVYTVLTLGGMQRVCGTATDVSYYNKLGNRRYLRFALNGAQSVTIRAAFTATGSADPDPDWPTPDPDIVLYRNGFLAAADSDTANEETLTRSLAAGDYVIEVYEFSHVDPSSSATRRGVTCMNVSVTN